MGWVGLPGYIKANLILLINTELWKGFSEVNDLETIRLDIKFKNFQKIESKRKEALALDRLISSDDDYVGAEISFQNSRKLPCKIRLKGDLSDHWAGDKWSFRVDMKKDNLVFGMSRFSLQKPGTRLNTSEWLFHNSLKKEGLMGLKYKFVNLVINGKKFGIYAIEEHFSKEMIEKNQRREGVILSFGEYRMWNFLLDGRKNLNWDDLYRTSEIQISNSNRVSKDPLLSEQSNAALNLLRIMQKESVKSSDIFAPERTGRFLALTHLFNAEHGLMYDDINFYFDPVTCLLEPIGFDANCETNEVSPYNYFNGGSTNRTWFNYALKSADVAYYYISYLDQFTRKEYIKNLKDSFEKDELTIRRLLLRELIGQNSSEIWFNFNSLLTYDPWKSFMRRSELVRQILNEKKPVLCHGKKNESNELKISIRNAVKQPVEILGFAFKEKYWKAIDCISSDSSNEYINFHSDDSIVLPAFDFESTQTLGDLKFLISDFFLSNPILNLNDRLIAKVRLLGLKNRTLEIPVPIDSHYFASNLLPFLGKTSTFHNIPQHDFIKEQNKTIIISKGIHRIKGDLYIPRGYEVLISSGTTLLFDENNTFISNGRIGAIGLPHDPITFTAANQIWGGLLIAGAKGKSQFENVKFSKMAGINKMPNPSGINRGGWTTTGGVTVHNSKVVFKDCTFENSFSEDALNLISSTFNISGCLFKDLPSDGFDGDFVQGEISDCHFENISGDGLDFSGSRVKGISCSFSKITDKAVSVGESSDVNLSHLDIFDCGFGVVSKDLSNVVLFQSKMEKIEQAGVSAYQKKKMYGPAKISCESVSFTETLTPILIQSHSIGKIDGKKVNQTEFKAEEYY